MERPSAAVNRQSNPAKAKALKFVLLIGVVSFFADFTYESSRSIVGPYLAVLGASATVVGVSEGFGELLGYVLRLVSGRLSDRTGEYWPITLISYFIQMTSVPLLALTGNWQFVIGLIITERIGLVLGKRPDGRPLQSVLACPDHLLRCGGTRRYSADVTCLEMDDSP